ncbi:MAG: UvrD-helicase domain-containing protein [Clostridiales bacterium]|nr:UvrD-helicase domain-containing protein [Clostridiales bacterium]
MTDIFSGLNEDQTAAVTMTEGFVRVVAGAGSGKTRTLAHRYAYLVKAAGIHPSNVLCVTFTSKAAGEMKSRVRSIIGDGYDNSLITTYHGFCARLLREDIHRLMYPQRFVIVDEAEQRRILSDIYSELDLRLDHASFEKLQGGIHRLKSDEGYVRAAVSGDLANVHIPPAPGTPSDPLDDRIARMYLERQKRIYGLDFDDLIAYTFEIFKAYPEVREKWSDRLYYIMVDEFQDSSKRELRLIKQLCAAHGNLFVVGDPDQNIYEWRGADMSIIVDFDRIFPGAETVKLTRNYRSSGHILGAANSLIANNKNRVPKDLRAEKPDGEKVIWYHAKSEKEEGKLMTDEIRNLAGNGYRYRDIAVLYRASFLSRSIEQALGEAGIPYEIYGSARFYDRMEIKDALSYVRLALFDDDEAFLRVINAPRRGFGKTRLAALKAMSEDDKAPLYETLRRRASEPPFSYGGAEEFVRLIDGLRELKNTLSASALLGEALKRSGYEDWIRASGSMERLDNLAELKRSVWEREQSWGESYNAETWLGQIAVESDEVKEKDADRVKLMTVHASKGLEFPAVFAAGMSEGIFPSSRTLEERKDAGLEEERRLCFVAVTRAMDRLYLSESEGTSQDDGKDRRKRPSRFLFELGEKDSVRIGELPKELTRGGAAAPDNGASSPGLAAGSEVDHPVFGRGKIESCDESKGVYYIRFEKSGQLRPVSRDYDFSAWRGVREAAKKAAGSPDPPRAEETPSAAPEPTPEPEPVPEPMPDAEPEPEPMPEPMPEPDPPTENEQITLDVGPTYKEPAEPEPQETNPSADDPQVKPEKREMPQRWRNAEWAKEPVDGDGGTDLWKREDVPHSGWVCEGVIDLRFPAGVCRMCGRQIIRYVHVMRHPGYPRTIGAGCDCAGMMEGDLQAARKRESAYKNRLSRRETFLRQKMKRSRAGNEYFKYKGETVTVMPDRFRPDHWKTAYKGGFSLPFPTKEEALAALFDEIDPWDYKEKN